MNGDQTAKEKLQALADESATKDSNAKYYNADADNQAAYNKAVEEAKAVLAKENVSQARSRCSESKITRS